MEKSYIKSVHCSYLTNSTILCMIFSLIDLTQIVELDLSLNQLTGSISSLISILSGKLERLNLDWNSFTGNFPSDIGNLTQINLRRNFLNGSLPLTITSTPNLTSLDLSGNEFGGKNSVLGEISSNNLEGSIDFTLFKNLNKLQFLKLSNDNRPFISWIMVM